MYMKMALNDMEKMQLKIYVKIKVLKLILIAIYEIYDVSTFI